MSLWKTPSNIDARSTVCIRTDDNVWHFTCKKWGPEIRVYQIEGDVSDAESVNEAFRVLAGQYGADRVVCRLS